MPVSGRPSERAQRAQRARPYAAARVRSTVVSGYTCVLFSQDCTEGLNERGIRERIRGGIRGRIREGIQLVCVFEPDAIAVG